MDKRQIINYANLTAVILFILGRVINIDLLVWIGMIIMSIASIWIIIHWKENDKVANYLSVAFLVIVVLRLFGL